MSAGIIGTETIVVMATYNEAASIGNLLDALPYPAIVVDDSSPDGTGEIAREKDALVISRPQKSGIASAYYDGFKAALEYRPKRVVQMDAGGTHDPNDARRLVNVSKRGYGLVIGSRFVNRAPLTCRSLISRTAAWLMRLRGVKVLDATSGFRCWQANLLDHVTYQPFEAKGFAFQLETLWRAHLASARIGEIAIQYRLTNSSFRPAMLVEALKIYIALKR